MQPHLVVIPVLLVLGFAGAWYWIHRPIGGEPPRGDDLMELWAAIDEHDRTVARRFIEVVAGVLVLACVGGALAGILTRVGAW